MVEQDTYSSVMPQNSYNYHPFQNTLTVWETYEHHQRLMKHANYPDLLRVFKPATIDEFDVQYVDFGVDPVAALEAPVTEIAILKPKMGASKNDFLSNFKNLSEKLIRAESCHSVIWGESRGHGGSFIAVIGWDSIQVNSITLNL